MTRRRSALREIPTDACRPLSRNPQYLTPHQMDALKASIERDGFLAPVLVRPRGRHYEVISGNHRVIAARELGLASVPALCVRIADREAARIAVNLNTIHGDPDAASLAPFLADLDEALLAEIHLEDDTLAELRAFDGELAERLAALEPVEAVDTRSQPNIPDCICPKCGQRHVSKRAADPRVPAPSSST
jgi:ParB-like chromosome segregation protein Spo0J